jgi:hypothetical protein
MSARTQVGLTTSVIGLLIFSLIIGAYYIQEVKKQSDRNGADIEKIKLTLNDFIKDRNIAFNYTYGKLEDLSQ